MFLGSGRFAVRLLSASIMAAVLAGPVAAASPEPGASVSFGTSTTTSDRTVMPMDTFCSIGAFILKLNNTTVGLQSVLNCSGTVNSMGVTNYLDRCTVEFPPGNCITWSAVNSFPMCSKTGPGTIWCPATGYFWDAPGAGRYKTRAMGWDLDESGEVGQGSAESNSVVLP